MIGAIVLAVAAASAPTCTPAALQAQVNASAAQMAAKDLAGAKASITPALACPVTSGPAYAAHVLRADIAVRQGDWVAVRDALAGAGFHPETKVAVRAAAFLLRADEALGDAKAFTADRAAAVAGSNGVLAGLGRQVEEFHAGRATVTAFEAPFRQDALRRLLEFVIVPDAATGYPRSILLSEGPATMPRSWTVDGYACQRRATLATLPAGADGSAPGYDAVKEIVVRTLEKQGVSGPWAGDPAVDAKPNSAGLCANLAMILPGIGARREASAAR